MTAAPFEGLVSSVSRSSEHRFSKEPRPELELVEGLGARADCHAGATVQHRSRVRRNANDPNLRQVHLLAEELYHELNHLGFDLSFGQLGENVTTSGLDLLGLPTGTRVRLGLGAIVEVTGLRNPCRQIERFRPGLLAQVLHRGESGAVVRRAGVMGVVVVGGVVRCGDAASVQLPEGAWRRLKPV